MPKSIDAGRSDDAKKENECYDHDRCTTELAFK